MILRMPYYLVIYGWKKSRMMRTSLTRWLKHSLERRQQSLWGEKQCWKNTMLDPKFVWKHPKVKKQVFSTHFLKNNTRFLKLPVGDVVPQLQDLQGSKWQRVLAVEILKRVVHPTLDKIGEPGGWRPSGGSSNTSWDRSIMIHRSLINHPIFPKRLAVEKTIGLRRFDPSSICRWLSVAIRLSANIRHGAAPLASLLALYLLLWPRVEQRKWILAKK